MSCKKTVAVVEAVVEAVGEFTYLGDWLSAGSECEADVCLVMLRECGE